MPVDVYIRNSDVFGDCLVAYTESDATPIGGNFELASYLLRLSMSNSPRYCIWVDNVLQCVADVVYRSGFGNLPIRMTIAKYSTCRIGMLYLRDVRTIVGDEPSSLDASSVVSAICLVNKLSTTHTGRRRGTPGAFCVEAVKGMGVDMSCELSAEMLDEVRNGVYGGMIYMSDTKRVAGPVSRIDQVSSYMSVSKYGLPDLHGSVFESFEPKAPGVARLTIDATDCEMPYPRRRNGKSETVIGGRVTGVYSNVIVDEMVKNGARVENVDWHLCFRNSVRTSHAVDWFQSLRDGTSGAHRPYVKMAERMLYGKSIQSRALRKAVYTNVDVPLMTPLRSGQSETVVVRKFGKLNFGITYNDSYQSFANQIWGVEIHGRAWVRTWRAMQKIGLPNVLYCDTDCVIYHGNEAPSGIDVGSKFGQWKHESGLGFSRESAKVYVFNGELTAAGLPSHLKQHAIANGSVAVERKPSILDIAAGHHPNATIRHSYSVGNVLKHARKK